MLGVCGVEGIGWIGGIWLDRLVENDDATHRYPPPHAQLSCQTTTRPTRQTDPSLQPQPPLQTPNPPKQFTFVYSAHAPPSMSNDRITINRRQAADHQVKMAICHALAQSTKLSVYEERVVDVRGAGGCLGGLGCWGGVWVGLGWGDRGELAASGRRGRASTPAANARRLSPSPSRPPSSRP